MVGYNCVKDLRVTKIVKKLNLKVSRSSQKQNIVSEEKHSNLFERLLLVLTKFSFCQEDREDPRLLFYGI